MRLWRGWVVVAVFAAADVGWGQAPTTFGSAAPSNSGASSTRKSFRPPPTPGQSQLNGRSLNLRDRGGQGPKLYLYTPPDQALAQGAARRSRTAQTLARLRGARQAQSMAAAQSLRPGAGRRTTGAGHKLTLGFDAPVPSALYEQKEVSRQGRTLAFVERQLGATDLQMERVGNRAILKGRVPSEERARLAERIARLEPGIQEVDNQLEIETAVPIEKN